MSFGNFHIDFVGLGQVLLGIAAVVAAWRSRSIAKEKKKHEDEDSGK